MPFGEYGLEDYAPSTFTLFDRDEDEKREQQRRLQELRRQQQEELQEQASEAQVTNEEQQPQNKLLAAVGGRQGALAALGSALAAYASAYNPSAGNAALSTIQQMQRSREVQELRKQQREQKIADREDQQQHSEDMLGLQLTQQDIRDSRRRNQNREDSIIDHIRQKEMDEERERRAMDTWLEKQEIEQQQALERQNRSHHLSLERIEATAEANTAASQAANFNKRVDERVNELSIVEEIRNDYTPSELRKVAARIESGEATKNDLELRAMAVDERRRQIEDAEAQKFREKVIEGGTLNVKQTDRSGKVVGDKVDPVSQRTIKHKPSPEAQMRMQRGHRIVAVFDRESGTVIENDLDADERNIAGKPLPSDIQKQQLSERQIQQYQQLLDEAAKRAAGGKEPEDKDYLAAAQALIRQVDDPVFKQYLQFKLTRNSRGG